MIPANVARFVVLAVIGVAGGGPITTAGGEHPRPELSGHTRAAHARPLRTHNFEAHPLPWPAGPVSGRIIVLNKGNKVASDVGQAVVWLEPVRGAPPVPRSLHMIVTAENKTFTPHIAVIPVGSSVTFPNRDGFDHNVFSLSDPGPFDLGLYERGDGKTVTFPKPGLIRVYCNIHSTMGAFIVVTDTPWYAQPSGDGTFVLAGVPAGEYILHAWHERAGAEDTVTVRVTTAGAQVPDITLDARGFRAQDHMNKFGKPYARGGRRY